jgi:4,4'-diapophytoene synthase
MEMEITSPLQIEGSSIDPRRGEDNRGKGDSSWHEDLLLGVSRTFALTIPQLPTGLRQAVTNAYLLCRIADTIEDDPLLDADTKDRFHSAFLQAVATGCGADDFATELAPLLAPSTLAAEVELIEESPRVLEITRAMHPRQRIAIQRCLDTMSHGMADFERSRNREGLADVAEYEHYCYFVAGVVGEMLTELFCDYSTEIDANRDQLAPRAVSFGLGLQMTNILKDIWDDLEHGTCWLPRDVFERHGYDLTGLAANHTGNGPAFAASMHDLVEIARGHLNEALAYTLAIPKSEPGIRRFLIWAVLLAVSTLGKISDNPLFSSGTQVKVSRPRVAAIVAGSSALIRSDEGLTKLFNTAGRRLPLDPAHQATDQIRKESTTS